MIKTTILVSSPKYSYGSDGKVDDIKITAKYLLLNEQTQKRPEDILSILILMSTTGASCQQFQTNGRHQRIMVKVELPVKG